MKFLLFAAAATIAVWFFCCRKAEMPPEKPRPRPQPEPVYQPPAYQKKLEESIKQKIQPKALQGMPIPN